MQRSLTVDAPHRIVMLPIYDEFPYLVTRLVPTLYHLIPLPESLDEPSLKRLGSHQWLRNQLPMSGAGEEPLHLF